MLGYSSYLKIPGVKKSFPKLRIAESLTKEKSQILSFSTVYFRFSVSQVNLGWKSTIFFKKCQIREFFNTFWIFLETLKTRIVLILKIVVLILIFKITQPWLLANVKFSFQKFEGQTRTYCLTVSLPETAVSRRFQRYP